jgi:hypothetical protein
MTRKAISLADVQDSINEAIAMCYDSGLAPKDAFVHIAIMMQAQEIKVYLNGETVWIGGDNYLSPEDFEEE